MAHAALEDQARWCIAFAGYPRDNCYKEGVVVPKPTYADIAKEVRRVGGFVPQPSWIAHVKADYGLTARMAPNRIDSRYREHPCPPEKRPVIVEAMRRLGMLALRDESSGG